MAKKTTNRAAAPDGIADRHADPHRRWGHHASWLSLGLLGAIVAIGLSGQAGGRLQHRAVAGEALEAALSLPAVVRNGEILETRLRVTAHRPIGKLVVGVEPSLWRELTTNSTVPTAAAESYEDGLIRFAYDGLAAGKTFELQLAQQVNPSLRGVNRGRIVLLDGERALAEMAVSLTVLP